MIKIFDNRVQLCRLLNSRTGFLYRQCSLNIHSIDRFRRNRCPLLTGTDKICFSSASNHGCSSAAFSFSLRIYSAAETGLEEFKDFIISDLQVTSACLCQESRIRLVKHVHTILPVLNPQAKTKLRVGPDIVIDRSAGFLRGQYQMNAKRTSYLCDADKLLHKFRFFPLQFCKLIDNDKQVRNRHRGFVALIKTCVKVYIVDAVLSKYTLSPRIFTLDADHRTAHLVP